MSNDDSKGRLTVCYCRIYFTQGDNVGKGMVRLHIEVNIGRHPNCFAIHALPSDPANGLVFRPNTEPLPDRESNDMPRALKGSKLCVKQIG